MPVACAAAIVWQPAQPALAKTVLPLFATPLRWKAATIGNDEPVVETVPITVVGVGETTPSDPQPASTMAPSERTAAMTAGWRTAQDSNEPLRPGAVGTAG